MTTAVKLSKPKKYKQGSYHKMGSCRKLARSVAHANMQRAQIYKPNRKNSKGESFFSRKWREYLTLKMPKRAKKRAI